MRAYLAHPVLGPRLVECARAVLAHPDPDRSGNAGEPVFQQVLDAFFESRLDPRTMQLLGA